MRLRIGFFSPWDNWDKELDLCEVLGWCGAGSPHGRAFGPGSVEPVFFL